MSHDESVSIRKIDEYKRLLQELAGAEGVRQQELEDEIDHLYWDMNAAEQAEVDKL